MTLKMFIKIKATTIMELLKLDLPRSGFATLLLSIFLGLASCAPMPQRVVIQPTPVPPPNTQVYFYPKSGQTPEQQDRDRYECYGWAAQQSGFDPNTSLPPEQRIRVVQEPAPGHDTIIGAVAGAVIGALAAGPRHAGAGALIGAGAGAVSDSAKQEQANQVQQAYAAQDQSLNISQEQKVANFRKAMGACLEGRGYSVQ